MAKNRRLALIVIFVIIGAVFFAALIKIQVLDHEFYRKKAEIQQRRFIKIAADRGDIFTRDGEVLATSLDTYSIYKKDNKCFKWLERKVSSEIAGKLAREGVEGVGVVGEKKRVYPRGHFASQVVGFSGLDNEGLAGIERSLDEYLKAKEGWIKTYADPVGFEFLKAKREKMDSAEEGSNVYLTIDSKLQYAAERECSLALQNLKANSATVIVMDLKTGEILALASKPDFDPNSYAQFDPKLWNSRAVMVYEPGSTFKVITAAAAIDEGVANVDTKLDALDKIEVGGKIIENSHQIKWPGTKISISYMLEQSVNTGAVQLALKLGKDRFYKMIRRFGFGEKIDSGLPGESAGILHEPAGWYKPDIAMISFGQSVAVTPLQLIAAIGSLGSGGKVKKPVLIKRIESRDGSFVKSFPADQISRSVSEKTAKEIMGLMRNVVISGSGRRAAIKNFSVCGKTGTAQKVVNGQYAKGRYYASFIGLCPVPDPRFCALVLIDEPKTTIWGESAAGPVFHRVVEEAMRFYNIKPDMI